MSPESYDKMESMSGEQTVSIPDGERGMVGIREVPGPPIYITELKVRFQVEKDPWKNGLVRKLSLQCLSLVSPQKLHAGMRVKVEIPTVSVVYDTPSVTFRGQVKEVDAEGGLSVGKVAFDPFEDDQREALVELLAYLLIHGKAVSESRSALTG